MSTSRRTFIRQTAGGIVGSWALAALPESSPARYIISDDKEISADNEEFWKVVRDQFPLTHDRIYFNNGTIGPSPYPVIEAAYHGNRLHIYNQTHTPLEFRLVDILGRTIRSGTVLGANIDLPIIFSENPLLILYRMGKNDVFHRTALRFE